MIRRMLAAAAAIALLGACSGGINRTVDRPVGEVEAMLQSSTDALALAAQLPGAGHSVERGDGRVVWHFTLYDQDYARFIISLAGDGPQATRVTTTFEEVNDASGAGLPYLREVAKAVGEESVAATLDGRAVDLAALQDRYVVQAAADPTKVVGATRQIWDEAAKMAKENNSPQSLAPPSSGPRPAYETSQPYDAPQPYDRAN